MELVYHFMRRTATHVCARMLSREGIARQVRPVFIISLPQVTKARLILELV